MIGWEIFQKSIGRVFSNFSQAIKIGGSILLVAFVLEVGLIFLITGNLIGQGVYSRAGVGIAGGGVATAVIAVVHLLAIFWIAVSWHRFLLLEETGIGILSKWRWRVVLSYLVQSVLIGLMIVVAMLVFALLVYGLATIGILTASIGSLLYPVAFIVASYLVLRLSAILPAIAIEKPISMGASWQASDTIKGAVLLLVFLSLVISALPGFLLGMVDLGVAVNALGRFAIYLFQLIFSITILTTLYEYLFKEKPPSPAKDEGSKPVKITQ